MRSCDIYNHHLVVPPARRTCVAHVDIPDPLSPLLPIVHRFLAGPQGYIPYPHKAAVCRFEQVALLLLGHVRGP